MKINNQSKTTIKEKKNSITKKEYKTLIGDKTPTSHIWKPQKYPNNDLSWNNMISQLKPSMSKRMLNFSTKTIIIFIIRRSTI